MNDRRSSIGFVNLVSSSVTELNVRSCSNRPSHKTRVKIAVEHC